MENQGDGLVGGSRVAVVGGGISAAAVAAALATLGKSRQRAIEVKAIIDPELGRKGPVLLTPECRSRLAALGCRVPTETRAYELRAIEVVSAGAREVLSMPVSGTWVVDAWPLGSHGTELVSRALFSAAVTQGVEVVERRLERVEEVGLAPGVLPSQQGKGTLVVRGSGAGERFHAVCLAADAPDALNGRFFPSHRAPPTLAAASARLKVASVRPYSDVARLLLSPQDGVDALLLLPCGPSIYALAFGRQLEAADLCQAVMAAARDGFIPEGFELADLQTFRMPAGAAPKLTAPSQVVAGLTAVGHPLSLGISDILATATRAAISLLDAGSGEARLLKRRYVTEGVQDLVRDAETSVRALGWLRHAGKDAAHCFREAQDRRELRNPFSSGVLGLPTPAPLSLLKAARKRAVLEGFRTFFQTAIDPLPPAMPIVEPDLLYVVDDDDAQREALTQALTDRGFQVVAFADELALYAAVARRMPAAILLDVVLSWVDGLSLCEGLKQHPLTRDCRVFVMSGLNRPHVRLRALDGGAEAFLPKPFSVSTFLDLLDGRGEVRDPAEREALRTHPAAIEAAAF